MIQLDFVSNNKTRSQAKQAPSSLYTGHRYKVKSYAANDKHAPHGLVGGYSVSPSQGIALSLSAPDIESLYLWDADIDLKSAGLSIANDDNNEDTLAANSRIKSNYIEITHHALDGPQLTSNNGETCLMLSMAVDFTFTTANYAAQLAVIHLVEATRFIKLKNGNSISLLDTEDEDPVLYLETPLDDQALKLIGSAQDIGDKNHYHYQHTIQQPIPDQFTGQEVESVTVLEQYRSYFMQRATPFDENENIWTPIYAPILWGWSIRVGRRVDDEWGILKRKLIIPIPGNDGLQLPEWETNTIDCSNNT